MSPLRWRASLRGRLTVASGIIMLLSAGILLFGNLRILQRTLAQQAQYQTAQITALLDQSIAAPLAQRDYALLQQTIERVIDLDSITYIVLFDHRGRRVVGAGWEAARALPARDTGDIDLQANGAMRHLSSKVMFEGQTLGSVSFGVSIAGLRAAQATFESQALLIAAFSLVLSFGLVSALATALTRHLSRLELSSRKIAAGDFDINVPASPQDEVGRLALSFNAMALALRNRIEALRSSEALQAQHLQQARDGGAQLGALVEAIPAGIIFVDNAGTILHANHTFIDLWQLPADPAGTAIIDLMPHLRRETVSKDAAALEYLLRAPMQGEPMSDIEFTTSDGRLISQQVRAVRRHRANGGYMCLHKDVTRERNTEQQAQLALRDPLTNLFNRRGLFDALQSATTRAAQSGEPLLLMFIDLDDFKHANDVGGHRTGDEILVTIAANLTEFLRDGNVVARLGGDEFAVICPGTQLDAGAAIAARVVEMVSNLRFATEHEVLHVGCSIGLAQFPVDAIDADALIACADTAMYEAKQRGKNGWVAYQSSSTRLRTNGSRIDWNGRIHRALADGRFLLHFQPVFHASGRNVAYHEALLRMTDENDNDRLIAPADFITFAERSGKIIEIDRWVFQACIEYLQRQPDLVLAANLSARSLDDNTFVSFLRAAIQRADIDPRRLHIELTETSAITDPKGAQLMIANLRAMGCAVHIDDFGSGFSSFSHLKLLDVDSIKIDGSFIRDLATDNNNQLFVGAMIAIARQLSKSTVAEHVEDQETLNLLIKLGIDYVQGFHMARPARTPLPSRSRIVALPDVHMLAN